MKYQPPTGGAANDPYVGRNLAAGIQGSRVPPKAVEHHQRELVHLIEYAAANEATRPSLDNGTALGSPSEGDLQQVRKAIQAITIAPLTSNLTVYVRTDGNDNNNGLANTAAGAFATIQGAINFIKRRYTTVGSLLTIQVANGTYPGFVLDRAGSLNILIQGNTTTPASCVISGLAQATAGSAFDIRGFTMTGGAGGLAASDRSTISFSNMVFSCGGHQISASASSRIKANSAYTVTQVAATTHALASNQSTVDLVGIGISVTGAPTFSTAFVWANNGTILAQGAVVAGGGSVGGQRYQSDVGGLIYVAGAGTSVFPGHLAGAVATGGQYI